LQRKNPLFREAPAIDLALIHLCVSLFVLL
jgi:hypothetical protein